MKPIWTYERAHNTLRVHMCVLVRHSFLVCKKYICNRFFTHFQFKISIDSESMCWTQLKSFTQCIRLFLLARFYPELFQLIVVRKMFEESWSSVWLAMESLRGSPVSVLASDIQAHIVHIVSHKLLYYYRYVFLFRSFSLVELNLWLWKWILPNCVIL